MIEVVVVIVVALGVAAMIGPVTVAIVMAAVAIKGLRGSTTVVGPGTRAIEIAARIRSGSWAIAGECTRAARPAA
jgi:hypothetical protein